MKIAVFYYSQTGQALEAARNICKTFDKSDSHEVVYKEIVSEEEYPFPWSSYIFWDTFPETRLGIIPSGIHAIDFSDIQDADMVLIFGQSWFLSPSLPIQSFFADAAVRDYLCGRDIVFVNVCRNMWLSTARKVKEYIKDIKGHLVGHIVLRDKAFNLVGVITIMRWLLTGRKAATRLFPAAGVSDEDIKASSRFGDIIYQAWHDGDLQHLQTRLLSARAIEYMPFVMFVEKIGHRMFGLWAKFIRRKGGFRDPARKFRLKLFSRYLMFALFVVSPIGKIGYYLMYPFRNIAGHRRRDCGVE